MATHLNEMDGIHVGLLDDEELALFERAVKSGQARRVYRGGSGFMGLARVELVKTGTAEE